MSQNIYEKVLKKHKQHMSNIEHNFLTKYFANPVVVKIIPIVTKCSLLFILILHSTFSITNTKTQTIQMFINTQL